MSPGPADRLLPWWWERQTDPTSPDVVPGPAAAENTTHRDWALLGTVGGAERAVVDPRGAVTPWPGAWSLDWWVGAEDRWHLPSRAAGVRQRLVGATPVVETVLRVPGGELVHRTWAVAAGRGLPEGGAVVVELENASPVPVAVAVAIRPFNPLGPAAVSAITLDGTVVSVDGRPAIVLPKPPSRVAVGSGALDSVVPTVAGDASSSWPEGGARDASGAASAAFLFPLPHTATLRVLLPLVPARPAVVRRRTEPAEDLDPAAAPDHGRVVAGWQAQTSRAPRLELPEPRLPEAVAAARCAALLHAAGEDVGSWPPHVVGGLDTAEVAIALDQHGFHAESERLLLGFADRQGLDGSFAGEAARVDAAAAWLHAVARHVQLSGDPSVAEALVGPVAKAAHHLRRRLSSRRGRRTDGPGGLFPPGPSAPWVPPVDLPAHHDALWGRRGLLDAAFLLEVAGQPEAAAEPRAVGARLEATVVAALGAEGAAGAGPGERSGAGALATAVALAATIEGREGALDGLEAALVDALDATPPTVRGAVWQEVGHAGLSPRLTAWLASARLAAGRVDAAEPLAWLLEHGQPLWAWPELVHPRSGGGCAGEGHHAASTAAVLRLTRRLAVIDRGPVLDLLPAVPDAWLGQPLEVHDLPTGQGRLSFALRWHGERPALLWELQPHEVPGLTDGALRLRAPGLDATWWSDEPRGEALLADPGRRPAAAPVEAPVAEPEPPPAGGPAPGGPARRDEPSTPGALDPPPAGGGGSFS
jgi:hypothetical protein